MYWPDAGLTPLKLGGEDGVDRRCAGGDVVDGDADLGGLAVGLAGHPQEAADALGHDVEPWPVAVGPGLAESTDGAVKDVLADLPHGVVVDAEASGDAGAEVLDHEVSAGAQFEEELAAALGLQVKGDRPLAAVGHRERIALAVDLRGHSARIVASARLLDLDDVRAELGENHRAVRARQESRQVEDPEAGEGLHESFPHCGIRVRYAGSLWR